MRCFVVLFMVLSFPILAGAGEKAKLVGLLADYSDLKQRVQEVQSSRKDGNSSDMKVLTALTSEIVAANNAVQAYNAQLSPGSDEKVRSVPLALTFAYAAMHQLVSLELARTVFKFELAATLSSKYDDIWQIIDPSIPVFSAP